MFSVIVTACATGDSVLSYLKWRDRAVWNRSDFGSRVLLDAGFVVAHIGLTWCLVAGAAT